jgi:hypothetical protein
MNTVDGTFYLIVRRSLSRGWKLRGRLAAKQSGLAAGEVALQIEVVLPIALFQRPSLHAKVTVPEGHLLSAMITADVQDNLAELLSEQLGTVVRISAEDAS